MGRILSFFLVVSASLVVLVYLIRIIGTIEGLVGFPDAEQVTSVKRIDTGTYKEFTVSRVTTPQGGPEIFFENLKHDLTTNEIDGRLQVAFGFRFSVVTIPEKSLAKVVFRVDHPPMKKPGEQTPSLSEEWTSVIQSNKEAFIGWLFEETYELVPGRWQLQLRFKDQVIAEEAFEVRVSAADISQAD